jgi:hypothetical protein
MIGTIKSTTTPNVRTYRSAIATVLGILNLVKYETYGFNAAINIYEIKKSIKISFI